jgi:predicted membrane protein
VKFSLLRVFFFCIFTRFIFSLSICVRACFLALYVVCVLFFFLKLFADVVCSFLMLLSLFFFLPFGCAQRSPPRKNNKKDSNKITHSAFHTLCLHPFLLRCCSGDTREDWVGTMWHVHCAYVLFSVFSLVPQCSVPCQHSRVYRLTYKGHMCVCVLTRLILL